MAHLKQFLPLAGLVTATWWVAGSREETDSHRPGGDRQGGVAGTLFPVESGPGRAEPVSPPKPVSPAKPTPVSPAGSASSEPTQSRVPRVPGVAPEQPAGSTTRSAPKMENEIPAKQSPNASIFERTVMEHFRSHPSTERRLVHLRELSQNRSTNRLPDNPLDLAVHLKNQLARASNEVFADVVGELTLEEEWQLGNQVHQQCLTTLQVRELNSPRLQALAKPILDLLQRTQGYPFELHLIDDPQVNAFAHMGGHIYVFQGLLDLVQHDHQLQFVLGHEIGHIELGQCAKAVLPGVVAARGAGELARLPTDAFQSFIRLSYSESDELDADAWSYRQQISLGYRPEEILSFFDLLRAHEGQ